MKRDTTAGRRSRRYAPKRANCSRIKSTCVTGGGDVNLATRLYQCLLAAVIIIIPGLIQAVSRGGGGAHPNQKHAKP